MSVRIGFIGAGGISRSHLTNLMHIEEAEVVALCDLSAETIDTTVETVNDRLKDNEVDRRLQPATYTDYDDMLRAENLDAVYICLPPFVHGEAEEAVIEAGLPMLVEKPLALDLATANGILEKVQAKGLLAASGYQLRYGSHLDRVKEVLTGRTIGMVLTTRASGPVGLPYYRFQDKSGGQLIEQATHQVDLLRVLVGEIDTVYAQADLRVNDRRVGPDYEIFDVNCMTLRFENGVVGNFANSQALSYRAPSGVNGIHIFADGVGVSIVGSVVRIQTEEGIEEVPIERNQMSLEDRAFVQAVHTGQHDLVLSDYASGVRTLAVTIAGERSARTGQPVRVNDLLKNEAPNAL